MLKKKFILEIYIVGIKGVNKMVFSSITFIMYFLVGVLILYYNPIFKSRRFKNIILFIASLFFYAWGEPIYI